MAEHSIAAEITKILTERGCWFETFEHQPVRTSEEAAALREGYSMSQGAKALIVRIKPIGEGKQFVMLVLPGDQKLDSAKVKTVLRSKDLRFATEEEVETITKGVKPGGVPPFGNLFELKVVVDSSLFRNEKIIFNAARDYSIAMRSEDYRKLVQPLVTEII